MAAIRRGEECSVCAAFVLFNVRSYAGGSGQMDEESREINKGFDPAMFGGWGHGNGEQLQISTATSDD